MGQAVPSGWARRVQERLASLEGAKKKKKTSAAKKVTKEPTE